MTDALKLSPDPLDRWATANPGRAALLVLVFYPVGTALLAFGIYEIADASIGLDEQNVVMSERSEFRGFGGAVHFINVGGREYECGGEDHKSSRNPRDWVVYDPEDPSRCRLQRNAQSPSMIEMLPLLAGAGTLTLAFTLHQWARRNTSKHGERYYRAGRRLLLAIVLTQVIFALVWGTP